MRNTEKQINNVHIYIKTYRRDEKMKINQFRTKLFEARKEKRLGTW